MVYIVKLIGNLAWDFIYFPLWWYTGGILFFGKKLYGFIANREKSLALFVWAKNITKPMYQQHNFEGRLISFFVRLIQIIFRSLIMLFWLSVCLIIMLLWIVLPILIVYGIYRQIIAFKSVV